MRNALKPTEIVGIKEWVNRDKMVYMPAVSQYASWKYMPWMLGIAEDYASGDFTHQFVQAPVGCQKSTLIEILVCYGFLEPSNHMIVMQSLVDVNLWGENRLLPILKASKASKEMMEMTGKGGIKRNLIRLPSGTYINYVSATKNSLQAKSIVRAIGDECWLWKSGLINDLYKRTQLNPQASVLLVSQGGYKGSDWQQESDTGERMNLHWTCKKCGHDNMWDRADIRWNPDIAFDEDGGMAWAEFIASVYMECPHCHKHYADTLQNRYDLSQKSNYVKDVAQKEFMPGRRTYNFPVYANYRSPWADMAVEWVKANREKKKGNIAPLREFVMQRLANHWDDTMSIAKNDKIKVSTFTKASMQDVPEDEVGRLFTIDCQGNMDLPMYFWVSIYTFQKGSIRLAFEGRIDHEDDLFDLKEQYNIMDGYTFIDSGYRTDEVLDLGCRLRAIALNGIDAKHMFKHRVGGKIVERPYSQPSVEITESGSIPKVQFLSSRIKDIAYLYQHGKTTTKLELPRDITKAFREQWFSEVKVLDESTGRMVWKQIRKDNHLFDTFLMALNGAKMLNYI